MLGNKKEYRQSRQRNRILEIMRSVDSHPTADWLYLKLKHEFPRLSLGTIYRNLAILMDQGFVRKIHLGTKFDRFEARIDFHYHLVCEKCGSIEDFEMPIDRDLNKSAGKLTDFDIHHHRIEFFGTCSRCIGKGSGTTKRR